MPHGKKQPSVETANSTSSLADELFTKKEAAQYLKTTPRYVERMASSGRLKCYKPTGKLWRTRRSHLDALLESGASIAAQQQAK